MSTKPEVKIPATAKIPAEKKAAVTLSDRIKSQLSAATLRNKITVDDLSDLEQHIRKLAGFLGVA